MRCPGYHSSNDLTIENIPVNVYVSPHELAEAGADMNRNVAMLVQSFGEDFALPHLRRFGARCLVEEVALPKIPCESHYTLDI